MTKAEAEKILGLQGSYTTDSVKKTYRELIRKEHPDVVVAKGGNKKTADRKMAEINAAYKYINDFLAYSGGRASVTPATYSAPKTSTYQYKPTTTYTPKSTYTPTPSSNSGVRTDDPWSAYRYYNSPTDTTASNQSETDASTPASNTTDSAPERKTDEPSTIYKVLHTIIAKFPYRILLFGVAVWLFWEASAMHQIPFVGPVDENPEMYFMLVGFFLAALVNLALGTMTNYARRAALWFLAKVFGRAPKEPSVRYAIFGHLPYRIMFFAFSIWWYWDYATYHVAESAWWDWPLRLIVFLAAGINMVMPIITDILRGVLIGSDGHDYYWDDDLF